jgi:hypothetical protein
MLRKARITLYLSRDRSGLGLGTFIPLLAGGLLLADAGQFAGYT